VVDLRHHMHPTVGVLSSWLAAGEMELDSSVGRLLGQSVLANGCEKRNISEWS